ncbi:MAG: threonylcarbamoyl-AMP synthase [Cytophagales bacterium]|nr:threonylcarbamoyl-AMP synthase [Cytophagales bacterium]
MARIGSDIKHVIELLNRNQLVGIPTETVYGLAGNAFNANAVAKIFEVKDRPSFDPLIVHAPDLNRVGEFVEEIPEKARELARSFWPGPLTLIFKKKQIIPDLVTSGLQTVAVRIPNHPFTLKVLESIDFPLAAPSANPFGYVSPTKAEHVDKQLGDKIPYVLDGGDCSVGIESTIVSFEEGDTTILRIGGCKIESIEKIVGKVKIKPYSNSNPMAPGMMDSHYSPLTPFEVGNLNVLIEKYKGKNIGILSFDKYYEYVEKSHHFVLSEKSDLSEAATRLFTGLRHLDNLNLQLIVSEYVPDEGLGRAINDRLKRAEAKRN